MPLSISGTLKSTLYEIQIRLRNGKVHKLYSNCKGATVITLLIDQIYGSPKVTRDKELAFIILKVSQNVI